MFRSSSVAAFWLASTLFALADDQVIRFADSPGDDAVRPVLAPGPAADLQVCREDERPVNGCVAPRDRALRDAAGSASDRREESRRGGRAAIIPSDRFREVDVRPTGDRVSRYAVETRGAPSEVTMSVTRSGAGHFSVRAGEVERPDGTSPETAPLLSNGSTSHRDLFGAGRAAEPPAVQMDFTLSPSGVMSLSQ